MNNPAGITRINIIEGLLITLAFGWLALTYHQSLTSAIKIEENSARIDHMGTFIVKACTDKK